MTTGIRSLLFAPGSDERKLRKAFESDADAVVCDLEDAVAISDKDAARALVPRLLALAAPGGRYVRVNAEDELLQADLAALEGAPVDVLVLPKATPESITALGDAGPPIVALVETAAGIAGAAATAALPRVESLMLGALDLSVELGLSPLPSGEELLAARWQLVLASALAGVRSPIDSPYPRLDDEEGLIAECRRARAVGFRAKACIHPAQVPVVRRELAPTADELAWARSIVDGVEKTNDGVVRIAGQMVDAPVVERARRLLVEAEGSS